MTVKPGAEPALPALRKLETEFRDAQAEALNMRLVKPTNGAIAIVNGDVFDSERGVMLPATNVIIRGDRIVAVGPAASTPAPIDAAVIDATGKTVLPGLWDMHGHMQMTSQSSGGVMQLSFGITTVRDLASDLDVAVSERDRAQAGRIAVPREILAGFMEGPLKWAGPTRSDRAHRSRGARVGREVRLDGLQADQALQPHPPRSRPGHRRRGAQARHARERAHSARTQRARRGRAGVRRSQSRRVSVLDVLSGFALHPDDARVLARRVDRRAEHQRRRPGDDGADRRPQERTTP